MFHGMNAVMFNIGMFSYMCMAMIPIFCRPEWPKKIIGKFPNLLQLFLPLTTAPQPNEDDCSAGEVADENSERKGPKTGASEKQKKKTPTAMKCSPVKFLKHAFLLFYVFAQIVLPYSHSITKVSFTSFAVRSW